MEKILLEKNRNVFSTNVDSAIDVALSTKTRLLASDNISSQFSLLEQYNKERDESNKFRLIFTINPICTNVLFNNKTEIIKDEGSDLPTVLIDGSRYRKDVYAQNAIGNEGGYISYYHAIRNTEYSHKDLGNFTYHCGLDIFNNHMLRSNEFAHVNTLGDDKNTNVYNTLGDYLRDNEGSIIKQDVNINYTNTSKTELHLYRYDAVLPFKTAFSERCIERDGWWGFINPSYINIPNRKKAQSGSTITINQMLANNKPCEFIDLYPDRSLYSFTPKFNKFKRRLEKNWDYCITYPYRNDYEKFIEIMGNGMGGIKFYYECGYDTNGREVLICYSPLKHNLTDNSYVNLYFQNKDGNVFGEVPNAVKVERIGDIEGANEEYVFFIKYEEVSTVIPWNISNSGDTQASEELEFFFKKSINDEECSYYFRKFKKLYNIDGSNLKSDINKIAFAKNIYGDDLSQIIYTDSIDINNLYDNMGKPLSEVFLTIIKRNAGWEEWYNNNNFSGDTMEFSHCFGKVTSGIDFSNMKKEPWDYNIHRLQNISETFTNLKNDKNTRESIKTRIKNTENSWGLGISSSVTAIERNITIDNDIFYGDIVEYDPTTGMETIISDVYHRFNTAQRETVANGYMNIYEDVIRYDDYDVNYTDGEEHTNVKFQIDKCHINNYYTPQLPVDEAKEENLIYGNIMPEGYFYKPHYSIKLKKMKKNVAKAMVINYASDKVVVDNQNTKILLTVPTDFGFYKGDFIAFYNPSNGSTIWGEIVSKNNNKLLLYFGGKLVYEDNFIGSNKFIAYWSPNSVPTYATICHSNGEFIWTMPTPLSELKDTDKTYDFPFSNGCLYVEHNINFFLRRQDPFGKYGLSKPIYVGDNIKFNPLKNFVITGETFDMPLDVISENKTIEICV